MTIELSNHYIFLGGLLALLCIISSILSRTLGTPLLLVFLLLGMLAGENGIGGIQFDDFGLALLFGNMALAIIIFDGGLGTRKESFRVSLKPAFALASIGVIITAAVTGLAVHLLLHFPWQESLLVGAIIGSTDAAAVFGLIRNAGLKLKERTGATLEIESGANDPMAIFLTITMVHFLSMGIDDIGWSVVIELARQLGLGLIAGFLGGYFLKLSLPKLSLPSALYPLMALAAGMCVFGLTNSLGGSGFLAIYIVGVVIGNSDIPYRTEVSRFHDGMAWLSQIGMFLMLGLLVTPSNLIPIILPAIAIAAVLIFVARPLAVLVSLAPFRFPLREQAFISWCGLRGAVPIILALYPSLAGLEHARFYFDLVFFVVIISLLLQGWTISPMAKWLKVQIPHSPGPSSSISLEFDGYHGDHLHIYEIEQKSHFLNQPLAAIPETENSQLMSVLREGQLLQQQKTSRLAEKDKLVYLSKLNEDSKLNERFAPVDTSTGINNAAFYGFFIINADATLDELARLYSFEVDNNIKGKTVSEFFMSKYHGKVVIGDRCRFGEIELTVREINQEGITKFGLKLVDRKR